MARNGSGWGSLVWSCSPPRFPSPESAVLRSSERQIQSVSGLGFHAAGHWSCSACGDEFVAMSSRLVHFRHADGRQFHFVVCPACGDELAPHRVVIDRDRLDDESDLAWLRSRVEEIAERRSMQDDRRLRLRATDVDELAAMLASSPVTLVQTLASLEIAEPA